MTFTPEAVEADRPRRSAVEDARARAQALRRRGLLLDASIELNKVVEGQSGDDEANKQRAEFFMGKTLFNLKYYSASLSYFDRIVAEGPGAPLLPKTLQWLASLSRFLPESAGVLEKIGKYTQGRPRQPALEPVRDELYYLLGRYHYPRATSRTRSTSSVACRRRASTTPRPSSSRA